MSLNNKTILITGGARRLGRYFALNAGKAGANIILHHSHSPEDARQTACEIEKFGVDCGGLGHPQTVRGRAASHFADPRSSFRGEIFFKPRRVGLQKDRILYRRHFRNDPGS